MEHCYMTSNRLMEGVGGGVAGANTTVSTDHLQQKNSGEMSL